jgi:hypothetical protein
LAVAELPFPEVSGYRQAFSPVEFMPENIVVLRGCRNLRLAQIYMPQQQGKYHESCDEAF